MLQVSGGATLTAVGANVIVTANGTTNIDGGSFIALNGAQIHLPQATSYTHTAGRGATM